MDVMLSSWDCFVNRTVKSVWLSCESLESDDDEIQGRVLSRLVSIALSFLNHYNTLIMRQ